MSFVTSLFHQGSAQREPLFEISNDEIRCEILKIQDATKKDNSTDKRAVYIRLLHDYAQRLIEKTRTYPFNSDASDFRADLEQYQIHLFDFEICKNDTRTIPSFPRFYSNRRSGFKS